MKTLLEIVGKKLAVVGFGRFNPPTLGHERLADKILAVAKERQGDPFLFVSNTTDATENPLTPDQKVKYLKMGVPQIADHVILDEKAKTIFQVLRKLIAEGYGQIILVVGADRVDNFQKAIEPYLNHPDPDKHLELDSFEVVSAGNRDSKSSSVEGVSASKMREYVANDDFESFSRGVSSSLNQRFAREMFDDIKTALNISEDIKRISNSLNIPRSQMPQIRGKFIPDFIDMLKKSEIDVHTRDMSIRNLKPTQNEINTDKVKQKYDGYVDGKEKVKPFIVSFDNHILDGHHQLFALKTLNPDRRVPCYVVGVPMRELLKYAHSFPMTTYKAITESSMKTLRDILNEAENKQPSASDKTKQRQEREKEQLAQRHAREAQAAREQDFRKKESDRRSQEQQKAAERAAAKTEDVELDFVEDCENVYEYLEDGTWKLVDSYKKCTPGQK